MSYTFDPSSPQAFVRSLLTQLPYFRPNSDGVTPIPWDFIEGSGPLVLVLGSNAGGKSFFRRLVSLAARDSGIQEVIRVSVEDRATHGTRMPTLVASMIYGSEDDDSTGFNSIGAVEGAIRTAKERKTSHMLYWDEPDLGTSDDVAAGIGVEIGAFCTSANLPANTKAVFLTTHNKALVSHLLYPPRPHLLFLPGSDPNPPKSIEEWLTRPIRPVLPSQVREEGRYRYGLIQQVINERKKSKT